jgi:peptidoglycan/LPS O-acetylase OafA/YrhL
LTDQPSPPRLAALDGLRGLAVLAVLVFHAESLSGSPLRLPGGFLGVSVFFTISGFVIGRLVLDEQQRTDHVDLGAFAMRRVARLAPAALATVALVVLVSRTAAAPWSVPQGFSSADALSAVGNVTNWSLAVMSDSVGFRLVHPLTHFWSLAVEAQLYVLFALTVLVLRRHRLRERLTTIAGWAWCGSLVMALVVHGSVRREEFGTDIRLAEFAAGVLLATQLPRLTPLLRRHVAALDALGTALLALFGALVLFVTRDEFWLGNGGYAMLGVAWALLLCSALANGRVTAVLSWPPLVRLGLISYSLYLVHWPIVLMLTDGRLHTHGWWSVAIRIVVSVLAAIGMHVAVEQPLRRRLSTAPVGGVLGGWLLSLGVVSVLAVALL